jgi:hypothetical protein
VQFADRTAQPRAQETHTHPDTVRTLRHRFRLARTPAELEQRHQTFIQLYDTTAHQGLLKDQRFPAIPVAVLGTARGRVYTPEELARHFAQAVVPRTTNRHGWVTLHRYHFYVEEGLPQMRVLLWVAGEQLRAAFDHVILAEYYCRYDWRDRKVTDIREGVFHHTRYASPQRALIPLTPQESWVIYRARSNRRRGPRVAPAQQLRLFELVQRA